MGTFDGKGFQIKNLTINAIGHAGLFIVIGLNGVIQNLGIENFDVSTRSGGDVGLLAAESSGTITDCYAVGNVNGGAGDDYVGGLVGQQTGGTITNSYATGNVSGGDNEDIAGGLVGGSNGTITNSYAMAEVNTGEWDERRRRPGGMADGGAITDSYATGNVNGGDVLDRAGGWENRMGRNDHKQLCYRECEWRGGG